MIAPRAVTAAGFRRRPDKPPRAAGPVRTAVEAKVKRSTPQRIQAEVDHRNRAERNMPRCGHG